MLWFVSLIFVLNPPFKFGVVGDTQINFWVAKEIAFQMRQAQVDFVVHLGDINTCASKKRWRWLRNKVFRGLKVHWVLGNHELMVCGRYRYNPSYRNLWCREFQRKATWKMFDHGMWSFFLLDSATPGIRPKQFRWIKKKLGNGKPFFVFSHRPLPCRTCRGWWWRKMDPMPYRWGNVAFHKFLQEPENKRRFGASFHGHWHGYSNYRADGISCWCSGGGGGLRAKGQKYHWLLVTIWGPAFWVQKIEVRRKKTWANMTKKSSQVGLRTLQF